MKWNKYTLLTTTEAEDIVASALADAGVQGVEIEDNTPLTEEELKGMFVDIPLAKGEDDGTARLNFYLDPEEDNDEILGRIKEGLDELRSFMDIGEGTITASERTSSRSSARWSPWCSSCSSCSCSPGFLPRSPRLSPISIPRFRFESKERKKIV